MGDVGRLWPLGNNRSVAEGDMGRAVGERGLAPLGNNLSAAEGESLLPVLMASSRRVGDVGPDGNSLSLTLGEVGL